MIWRSFWIISALTAVAFFSRSSALSRAQALEWDEYKLKFNKDYTQSNVLEARARSYYFYNKRLIENHNRRYELGNSAFKLAVNQYTDRHYSQVITAFPTVSPVVITNASPPPIVPAALTSYDPIKDSNLTLNIENQGTVCKSGWAYSVAKAVEMLQARQTNITTPARLSAQNLIDCAGMGKGCTEQSPITAFDYLTKFNMGLHLASDYPNNNTLSDQGMCLATGDSVTKLASYSRLRDVDIESLMAYVSNGYAVVVEIVPNYFEFIHYSEGIYHQPSARPQGSHYVLVIGYGQDSATAIDYWLVQNSFGTLWGENGLIRIKRSAAQNIFKNAIFPTSLA